MDQNVWDQILAGLRAEIDSEDFRRWFGATAYASDSGDQITVWVPSESIRRHILTHYLEPLDRALLAIGRPDVHLRLVVAGFGDEDEELDASD
jgi:chromosomal replication initiation ATPase DnaA